MNVSGRNTCRGRVIGVLYGKDVFIDEIGVRKIAGHGVSIDDIVWVLEKPDSIYTNTLTGRIIVVRIRNKKGFILVVDDRGDCIQVVTCWYSSRARNLVSKRRRKGRWV